MYLSESLFFRFTVLMLSLPNWYQANWKQSWYLLTRNTAVCSFSWKSKEHLVVYLMYTYLEEVFNVSFWHMPSPSFFIKMFFQQGFSNDFYSALLNVKMSNFTFPRSFVSNFWLFIVTTVNSINKIMKESNFPQ